MVARTRKRARDVVGTDDVAIDARESSAQGAIPQGAIPGLPEEIVVAHILGSANLPDAADLAHLKAVSRAMRDAVGFTGRQVTSPFVALADGYPDLFREHVVPQMDLDATLSLAMVNRTYRAHVWNKAAVRTIEAKVTAHAEKYELIEAHSAFYEAALRGNLPAIEAIIWSDELNVIMDDEEVYGATVMHAAAQGGHAHVIRALVKAG